MGTGRRIGALENGRPPGIVEHRDFSDNKNCKEGLSGGIILAKLLVVIHYGIRNSNYMEIF
jgi:hypothetical protein